MPAFTTESLVRLKFQLASTADFPATLIADAIDEAHEEVAARLAPSVNIEDPPGALMIGETLLAGARTLRSLAAREAAVQRHVTVGGQRLDTTPRHAQLALSAARAEEQAWAMLAQFLAAPAARTTVAATDSVPVLGAVY